MRTTEQAGIDELVNRLGLQTGLFGGPGAPPPDTQHAADSATQPPWNPEEFVDSKEEDEWKKDGEEDITSRATLLRLLEEVDTLSVRELKAGLEKIGASATGCIEKAELQTALRQHILARLNRS